MKMKSSFTHEINKNMFIRSYYTVEQETLYRRQKSRPSHGKEMQTSKMGVWIGLTNSCEKKRSEKQRRKERYPHLNAEFQRIARIDKEAF